MPPLYIFKENFVQKLRVSVKSNIRNYLIDDVWVNQIGFSSERELPTLFDSTSLPNLILPVDDNLYDIENSVLLHKSLSKLTPLQARDPRLWTRLSHIEYWSYMRKRWAVERYVGDGDKKTEGRILERYFILQSQGRSLIRNAISRLWWSAHLSHSDTRENPYELTHVLMSTLDITQSLLERSIGRAPNILLGFLEFLNRHKEDLLTGGNENRLRIRHLAKYLNMYGGVSVLDYLPEAQIIEVLEAEYSNIVNAA